MIGGVELKGVSDVNKSGDGLETRGYGLMVSSLSVGRQYLTFIGGGGYDHTLTHNNSFPH